MCQSNGSPAFKRNQDFSARLGSLFAVALNSTIAIIDDKNTWSALNTPLRANAHNRMPIVEVTVIPTFLMNILRTSGIQAQQIGGQQR
ncbi:MAG: hypothetical protein QW468_01870 [Candidatus Bathyarchaeia archaeon]